MKNIALKISYDGTDFHGFQIQKNAYTIEEELTKVLKKLTKEDIKIIGCGRTDTGVHAYEYMLNFFTISNIPIEKLPDAIGSNCHKDISVLKAYEVSDDFHARFSAIKKTYIYKILNSKNRNPFLNRFAYRYGGEIDIEKIKEGAKYFVGEHDFTSHKSKGTDTKTSVREILNLEVFKTGDIIEIHMTANGFLYNMARTIAGTLLECGTKKIDPSQIPHILESLDRTKAGPTLPPEGLFMKKTFYKEDF